MYTLYSKKGNYFVETDDPLESSSVVVRAKDGLLERMRDDETTDVQRIKRSIEKWEFIAALIAFGIRVYSDGGIETCALCLAYNQLDQDWDCTGCPVYEDSGERHCQGTPYEDFVETSCVKTDERLSLANQEVGFLQGVLSTAEVAAIEAPF